jgi:hypothetical protein
MRVLKKSLVTLFIGPFSYKNMSGPGTFSTLSKVRGSVSFTVEIRRRPVRGLDAKGGLSRYASRHIEK